MQNITVQCQCRTISLTSKACFYISIALNSIIHNSLCPIWKKILQYNCNPCFPFLSFSSLQPQVIFVLSRHFVNSEWCNYELYFAQQRAMRKTFSDVILVVKEPIDPSSLPSKYCKLKKMLSTKTYLEWPQQVNQQAFFWAQLKSVLGKPTTTREGAHSIKSRTSSVGSTSVIGPPMEDSRPQVSTPDADKEAEPKKEIIKRNNDALSNQR